MLTLTFNRSTVPRRAVVRHSSDPSRDFLPIFQAHDKVSPITLWDVEDTLHVCRRFHKPQDAEDYSYAQGVHFQNAVKYYQIISMLMVCYMKPSATKKNLRPKAPNKNKPRRNYKPRPLRPEDLD